MFGQPSHTLKLGDRLFDLTEEPLVMGILNLTPDSFYSNSRLDLGSVVYRANAMIAAGASILDIGGYSTRPGAAEVSLDAELERVLPAIAAIKAALPTAIVSIDTFRMQVASEAIKAGATLVNDVSGGKADADMLPFIAKHQVPYVLMHSRGTPATMQSLTQYDDITFDIIQEIKTSLAYLHQHGHYEILIDPGFGFAKTVGQNYTLLKQLKSLEMLGHPLLVGLSRKSMAYKPLGLTAETALNATTALHTLALTQGAKVLRVHDVAEAYQAIQVWKLFSLG
jgi:dihydropteroate synthase